MHNNGYPRLPRKPLEQGTGAPGDPPSAPCPPYQNIAPLFPLHPRAFIVHCRGASSALQDMMHGTLEVKQEGLLTGAVKKPEWMEDITVEAMTEEQRKVRERS